MGGDLFFSENSKYCCTKVEHEELEHLKKQGGKINPGNNWDIPPGLRLALCCFFLGSIYKIQSAQNEDEKFSFLAHIDHKQISHRNLEKIIRGFVVELDKALREKSSTTKKEEALKWLNQAYEELNKTANNLPSLHELVVELKHELRNAIPKVIDASNPDKEPKYNPGMNILIGGNRLGRGVTIDGLMVTYYGRDPKQKVIDTVHQYYEVDIDFLSEILLHMPSKSFNDGKWEDKRVKQALKAIKARDIHNGRFNVRRGKNGEGLDLTRQEPDKWTSYGFATSKWLSQPKNKYPHVPTLVVMYEKGEKERKWDDQPLYLPVLILPKSKFVFMFNYSDESEELEELTE